MQVAKGVTRRCFSQTTVAQVVEDSGKILGLDGAKQPIDVQRILITPARRMLLPIAELVQLCDKESCGAGYCYRELARVVLLQRPDNHRVAVDQGGLQPT